MKRYSAYNHHNDKSLSALPLNYKSLSLSSDYNQFLEDSDEDGDFIEYEIKLKYDQEDGVISYDTIVDIFNKR